MIDLRNMAWAAFDAAVAQADPARAVEHGFAKTPPPFPDADGQVYLLAIGKAAPSMLRAALPHFSDPIAICVTHHGNTVNLPDATVYYAGHPVPDAGGQQAAQKIIEVLKQTTSRDQVIALISGGGSALLPAPPSGVTLEDKQQLNAVLLESGLDIVAMNNIRQQVSRLKGGGLLRHAAPAPVTAYILSDVIGDDLRAIASGPTVAPLSTRSQAVDLLRTAQIFDKLPSSIQSHLMNGTDQIDMPEAQNHLVGSNRQSVLATVKALPAPVDVIDAPLIGDVQDAAQSIVDAAHQSTAEALVWGGETTVILRGNGSGGRNQELALRVAMLLEKRPLPRSWVFLSGGTDGRDGPTDAAGGIVDADTLARIRAKGLNPETLLHDNDSYAALAAADDLLMTGATGTNVADIQVFLFGPR